MKPKTRIMFFPPLMMAIFIMLTTCSQKEEDIFAPVQFNPDLTYDTLTDVDGNIYKTITIGTQTWMAENLKVTTYRNGTPIPKVTDFLEWWNLTTGAYCNPNFFSNSATSYGMLYNWYTISDTNGLAPYGWHVPTDNDWTILTSFLEGGDIAGSKLKEKGTVHWKSPNDGASNESGFTALPAGYLNTDGDFLYMGRSAYYWSSKQANSTMAWYRNLKYNSSQFQRNYYFGKRSGLSIRCIKDN